MRSVHVDIPGPDGWPGRPPLSQNVRHNRFAKARIVRGLRESTVGSLRAQGVSRGAVFVEAALWFRPKDRRSRPDPSNLLASLKPVVDALQPYERVELSNGRLRESIGFGLIPNDSVEFCRQTDVRLLDPVPGRDAAWGVTLLVTYPAPTATTPNPDDGHDDYLAQRFADASDHPVAP